MRKDTEITGQPQYVSADCLYSCSCPIYCFISELNDTVLKSHLKSINIYKQTERYIIAAYVTIKYINITNIIVSYTINIFQNPQQINSLSTVLNMKAQYLTEAYLSTTTKPDRTPDTQIVS